jgi:hypothetical protein
MLDRLPHTEIFSVALGTLGVLAGYEDTHLSRV